MWRSFSLFEKSFSIYRQEQIRTNRADFQWFNPIGRFPNWCVKIFRSYQIDQSYLDSQYRQIANNENGSLAGFLYQPNFHTVLNVLKDYFNSCSHVSLIFCGNLFSSSISDNAFWIASGQQVDTSGGLILSDSIFVAEHISHLFEENSTLIIEQLQILLPFISHQWTRLLKQKFVKHIDIEDIAKENNANSDFGQIFTQKLMQILHAQSVSFDIYNKLIPRDSSGTSETE